MTGCWCATWLWPQADPGQVVYEIVTEASRPARRRGRTDRGRVQAAIRESLRDTWFELSHRLGSNRGKWRWGRLHHLEFLDFGPGGWGKRSRLGRFEVGGSGATINTAEFAAEAPYDVRLASIYRFAVDAGALDRSLSALAPGQSEHLGHPHYADGLERWLAGRPTVLATARVLVEDAAVSRLVLEAPPP